jgi:hypothetical protein
MCPSVYLLFSTECSATSHCPHFSWAILISWSSSKNEGNCAETTNRNSFAISLESVWKFKTGLSLESLALVLYSTAGYSWASHQ